MQFSHFIKAAFELLHLLLILAWIEDFVHFIGLFFLDSLRSNLDSARFHYLWYYLIIDFLIVSFRLVAMDYLHQYFQYCTFCSFISKQVLDDSLEISTIRHCIRFVKSEYTAYQCTLAHMLIMTGKIDIDERLEFLDAEAICTRQSNG